jgi:hypothetical protein
MTNGNAPDWKLQQGALSAAAWKNSRQTSDGRTFEGYSMRIERRYKDSDGNWKSSNSYTLRDLFALQHFVGSVIDAALSHGDGGEGQ